MGAFSMGNSGVGNFYSHDEIKRKDFFYFVFVSILFIIRIIAYFYFADAIIFKAKGKAH